MQCTFANFNTCRGGFINILFPYTQIWQVVRTKIDVFFKLDQTCELYESGYRMLPSKTGYQIIKMTGTYSNVGGSSYGDLATTKCLKQINCIQ